MKTKVLAVLGLFAASAWSAPVTVIFQDGLNNYAGNEDTYISNLSSSSNGTKPDLIVMNEECSSWSGTVIYEARVALKFDLTKMPKGATIQKAVISLYGYAVASGQTTTLQNGSKSLYKITTTAWSEAGIKWSPSPVISTTALATSSNTQLNTWETFDVTSDIKAIVEEKGVNNGYLLKFSTHDYGIKYRSSDYATVADRPKLTVTYDPNTNIVPQVKLPRAELYNVTVMTIQGRMISSFVAKDLRLIDRKVNSLSSGVHIVTISTPDMKHSAKMRFVK